MPAENVTDLIAKPVEKYDPEPRYVSKYREKIIKAEKEGKSAHKTLGVPTIELDSPLEYLKKGTGIILTKPQVRHKHYKRPDYQRKLPEWQPIKASELDKQFTRNRIDFMKRNFEETKNLRPAKARKYYVDDRHGNAQSLKASGMYPVYIHRKDYGEMPKNFSQTMDKRSGEARKKTAEHSRGEDKSKTRSRQKTTSPRVGDKSKERPKQKTTSPRVDEKSRGRPREKTTRVDDKSREKSGQKTTSLQDEDNLSENLRVDSTSRQMENELKRSSRKKSTSSEIEDESTDQQKDEIKSLRENKNGKEASRIRQSVEFSENDEKQSTRSSRVHHQQPRCRYVTEDERAELLYGMKKKWDETMKIFQGLPFLTDTQPKAKRKSTMEKDLLQLEKDIEMIERHPYIYVYSDDEED